jgi:hypothetical protein
MEDRAMRSQRQDGADAPARALALLTVAHGRVDESELLCLDALDAWRQLGVSREHFVELARSCLAGIGSGFGERSWLRDSDLHYINPLFDAVADRDQRLLVCRLAACVVRADGLVTNDERMVYDHALARWHVNRPLAADATLQ